MLGPYATVLRSPGVPSVIAAVLPAGIMVNGALPLAMVLFVEGRTESFATAGAVAAAYALAAGITSPPRGRLIDRYGQTRPLLGLVVACHAALLSVIALALAGGPPLALVVLAGIAGAVAPPLIPALRVLWPDLVPAHARDTAYALQSVLIEAMYLGGPLVSAAMTAATGRTAAILAIVGVSFVSGLAFITTSASRAWRAPPREANAPNRWGALATPAMRTLVLAQLPYGAVIGALDVAAPAFAGERGDAAAAGVLLSSLALGSLIGGAAYGSRTWSAPPARRYLATSGFLALALMPAALLATLPGLAALLVVAGLAIAPSTAMVFALLDHAAPAGTATEAMTWIVSAYAAGAAAGAAAAGALSDVSAQAALAILPAAAALAVVPVALRYETLRACRADGSSTG